MKSIQMDSTFIDKIKEITKNKEYKYSIMTMGCQLNENDSEKISGILEEAGYTKTENLEESNIIVFNTCCVRENAEDWLFGKLGEVKEDMTQENATMISLSDEDKLLLAKAIYAEAGICGVAEQEAVGITILNRAKQDNCSIYEVLTAPGQFSSVINGKPSMIVNKTVVPIEEEHITSQVWEVVEILSEGKETEVEKLLREEAERLGLDVEKYAEGGPLYFYNPEAVSQKQLDSRKNVKCSVRIGYQVFYKYWDT